MIGSGCRVFSVQSWVCTTHRYTRWQHGSMNKFNHIVMMNLRQRSSATSSAGSTRNHRCSRSNYLWTLRTSSRRKCTSSSIISALLTDLTRLAFWVSLVASVCAATAAAADHKGESSSRTKTSGPRGMLYTLLGVSPRASQTEIKRVFRRLALDVHPDKLGPFSDKESEAKANDEFIKVTVAYGASRRH